MEESAEAPPAVEEARRFRGSVLTAGRGSGWEPADTAVSAEEHAKKSPPKWVVIYVIVHRFCCLHSRTSQGRGSVRGEPLTGSPTRVQSPARRRPLLRSKSAAPKRKHHPDGWCFLFGAGDEARTRYLDLGKVALYQMSYARKRKIDYNPAGGICQPLRSAFFSFFSG